MSTLLRDATAANSRNKKAQKDTLADRELFEEFNDNPPTRVDNQRQGILGGVSAPAGKEMDKFDLKAFTKEFLDNLKGFGSFKSLVPEDINSYKEYDKFCRDSLPEIRLEMRIEMERLNQELMTTLVELRAVEHKAENAVALDKERAVVVSILYDRKDLQNKAALITEKKMKALAFQEMLEQFETFAELSRDYQAFQKVTQSFANDHKIYFPQSDPEPDLHMSLAYSHIHAATQGFTLDTEPIHDYMVVEFPGDGENHLKRYIEQEYQVLQTKLGKNTNPTLNN